MFGPRHPFAQYYANQQGLFGTDPDTGSWHSPTASPYTSSCARPYDEWSPSSGHQPTSPACSHASSPGVQMPPTVYGYHHPGNAYPHQQQHHHHQVGLGRMTPNSADYGPPVAGSRSSHFVFPEQPHHHATPISAAHHQACSPDSGVALGSDGGAVSGSESPTHHHHPIVSHSGQGGDHLVAHYTPGHPALEQAGIHTGGCVLTPCSRPQPARSPFEWMTKTSYQIRFQPGKTRTKEKYRIVYSDHQRLELEKEFHYSRYITIRRKCEMAAMLGLSERQVKIWFQNRRAKDRKLAKKREELFRKEFEATDLSMLKLETDSVVSLCGSAKPTSDVLRSECINSSKPTSVMLINECLNNSKPTSGILSRECL